MIAWSGVHLMMRDPDDAVPHSDMSLCAQQHSNSSVHTLIFNPIRMTGVNAMLYWTGVFLVIALIAAIFGFGGIAAGAVGIAKILFFIFIVLFLLSLIFGLSRRGAPKV
jgi:uncharacterized membrane protein YtjA (UPF0391 family)